MGKVKCVKFVCNICGEEHGCVNVDELVEQVKKSPAPVFTCPKCGEDGLAHINNVHLRVLVKYLELLNILWEAIEAEQEKLARHGVSVELIES
ncbi:hypothetical protein TST_1352 [Thermosulfidibacter takaii ABI70S6]|uniref:Uncharacterized protein n=1 Tax=Thermosulfidibacter takaii (strain DSM 17441 / JCM 13301 / NBRC 103674 / ABI70S6) TaxID=1298851 RepID=A0A0S3QUZ5_THET7|nr:hypothetical protein [Thermosulfidibacter takaii]BAT72139.1 hypothetical protein TST_1352 [Thermosulfidibacter takaii ABI70S6]